MSRRAGRCVLICLLAAASLGIGGCPAIGWVVAQFDRPKEQKALYKLPRGKRVLVLAESRGGPADYEMFQRDVTRFLNSELRKQGLVKETISYGYLSALRSRMPDYRNVPISVIGQKAGAEMVIYVEIEKLALKDNPADDMWHGQVEARVKVITADRGVTGDEARLWPQHPPNGHPVKTPDRDPVAFTESGYGPRLARFLAAQMADCIAKLFYTHELEGFDAWDKKASGEKEDIIQ